MNYTHILNYLSLTALVFMSFGILRQWRHVAHSQSAKDIVFSEVAIRFGLTAILWIKIYLLHDKYLIVGQSALLFALTVYIVTLARIKLRQ
ncbi:MAG: hypothetical protein KW806_00255 [Candidatus Yanofskybacteria bacterium]|nr:hypothetical protein [Candidatus Yanofskybacteria bacterium]